MISLQAQELFTRLIAKNESSCEKIIQFSLETASRRGLLGYTEELSMPLLYSALVQGIFPWYNEDKGEPVLWWSPDPRFVLFPEELHVPKSLAKFMKHSHFSYTMDTAFEQVINECSSIKRKDQRGTWIGSGIKKAYTQAFYDGNAHSFEVWNGAKLAGGFYGVLIGSVFLGESMFSHESDSAKSAFVHFVHAFKNAGGKMIDSQVYTDNISRFGGKNISQCAFLRYESEYLYSSLQENLKDSFYKTGEKKSE